MEVERSSLCNCVVNFLLEENYLLTAFELLHELLDDGRHDQAIRLQQYFSDPARFPPNQISRLNSLPTADPQTLLQLKNESDHKLSITDYELRLANEDIAKLKSQLYAAEAPQSNSGHVSEGQIQEQKPNNNNNHSSSFTASSLGPLKDTERRDLNCAVKEYLLIAGYRLTAMTFYEEVTDQNLDNWQNTSALMPQALRHYYYQYLLSTSEVAEAFEMKEKIAQVPENITLLKENERLNQEKESLLKDKDLADGQIAALTKSLEALQRDLKEKENMVQVLKQSLENQRKGLHASRVEISKLKMSIEGSGSGNSLVVSDVDNFQPVSLDEYKEEIKKLQMEVERLKEKNIGIPEPGNFVGSENETLQIEDKVREIHEDQGAISYHVDAPQDVIRDEDAQSTTSQTLNKYTDKHEDALHALFNPANGNSAFENIDNVSEQNVGKQEGDNRLNAKSDSANDEAISEKMATLLSEFGYDNKSNSSNDLGLGTIQILADALPKIVPYVLINHREELLPLMMCAIEHHPDSSTRDSLTHTLFNLIKRPDEQQRRIIMDINHMYEERRLLVAQSCGELAEFVRPEIRDSLILSIVQQLIEDSATIVREAAAHNLAMLLPLFQNMDKYFKVEELMFQLICDPSGVVVETTLKELVLAIIKWGNKLDHILGVLFSHILSSAQHCPPLSVIEGCIESHLHELGERERWNIDVLLRMLMELLPLVHQKAIETCPFLSRVESTQVVFSATLFELYARGHVEWDAFEWMHVECFPKLIQLACLLPWKEDNLRSRISKFLLSVSERFGDSYTTCIMLPVFLTAVGDDADLTFFPSLRPKSVLSEKLSILCVLPLLLAGVLGASGKRNQLEDYSRKLLVEDSLKENLATKHTVEIINAVRFICIYEENHGMIFNILWEMVVSSNVNMKISAAKLLKAIISQLTAVPTAASSDLMLRQERANAFCEAIRALDATDLPANSVRDYLLPAIQNLLKDLDALDPAHKEAIEIIMKERSGASVGGGASKSMASHLGIASSVSNFFGDGGLLGKKDSTEAQPQPERVVYPNKAAATSQPQPEDTRLKRIMLGHFSDILRTKGKSQDE
ncbi:hypothetical protein JHK87_011259 [Glycine soja]|nr:hypothetical protein JHK87_011259 [Glycine soja]